MKKILLGGLLAAILSNAAFAGQTIKIDKTFKPMFDKQEFYLPVANDFVQLENHTSNSYSIHINVGRFYGNYPGNAAYIENCIEKGHTMKVEAGSTKVCYFTNNFPIIIRSNDGSTYGHYQIQ